VEVRAADCADLPYYFLLLLSCPAVICYKKSVIKPVNVKSYKLIAAVRSGVRPIVLKITLCFTQLLFKGIASTKELQP
jgi:hypothetical protein